VTAPISNNERERLQVLESELRRAKDELARLASQQGEAAESLRAAEEFKSRLVACSRDCIKVLDLEGHLLFTDLTPELRLQIESHLAGCSHCAAVHDGLRNVVQLLGDDKLLEVPEGFGKRLYQRLLSEAK